MEIIDSITTQAVPQIQRVIVFDPWPFEDELITLADDVRYIGYANELHSPGNWALGAQADNRLAILSDGSTAVLADEADINKPIGVWT